MRRFVLTPRFYYDRQPGLVIVRIFHHGFKIKDTRRHRLLFSERTGQRSGKMIGPWYVGYLRP